MILTKMKYAFNLYLFMMYVTDSYCIRVNYLKYNHYIVVQHNVETNKIKSTS